MNGLKFIKDEKYKINGAPTQSSRNTPGVEALFICVMAALIFVLF